MSTGMHQDRSFAPSGRLASSQSGDRISTRPTSSKRFFRLSAHTLKCSGCVALLDVAKCSIGQDATISAADLPILIRRAVAQDKPEEAQAAEAACTPRVPACPITRRRQLRCSKRSTRPKSRRSARCWACSSRSAATKPCGRLPTPQSMTTPKSGAGYRAWLEDDPGTTIPQLWAGHIGQGRRRRAESERVGSPHDESHLADDVHWFAGGVRHFTIEGGLRLRVPFRRPANRVLTEVLPV